jgi:putative membrane protein
LFYPRGRAHQSRGNAFFIAEAFFSETFSRLSHPRVVNTPRTPGKSGGADQEIVMLIRLSAALATGLLLSGAAFAQGASKPTDPQIAHIAYTAGQIDITAAKQAIAKSKNKEVVAFARDMLRDHEAVNEQALDLVKKLKVTPEDNDTSRALSKQAAEKQAAFAKLKGPAYDKAYLTNEVAFHKTVNGALESQLIPSANNAELKSLLQAGLKVFQGHEQHAAHVAAATN